MTQPLGDSVTLGDEVNVRAGGEVSALGDWAAVTAGGSVPPDMVPGNSTPAGPVGSYNTTVDGAGVRQLLSEENDAMSRAQVPLFALLGVFMLVGIVGNSLVIHVYWHGVRNSSKKTFILAMALLDLGVCLVVIPFELYDLRNQLLFYSGPLCRAMRLLEYATVVAAGLVLVSVSCERYYFLCKVFQNFTPTKSKVICAVCSVIAVLVALPSGVFAGLKSRTVTVGNVTITGSECSMDSEKVQGGVFKRIYYYFLAFIFIVCIFLLIFIYIMIARLLRNYNRGELLGGTGGGSLLPGGASSSGQRERCSRDDSSGDCPMVKHQSGRASGGGSRGHSPGSVIVFFSVTVVFVLSFLPHLVLRIVLLFEPGLLAGNSLAYNLIVRSYLISNVSNPFIYSILNESFRKQLKNTFMRMSLCFFKAKSATVV